MAAVAALAADHAHLRAAGQRYHAGGSPAEAAESRDALLVGAGACCTSAPPWYSAIGSSASGVPLITLVAHTSAAPAPVSPSRACMVRRVRDTSSSRLARGPSSVRTRR